MSSGSGVFEDHKSPSSATDPMSGSNSPHIVRPTLLPVGFNPGGLMHNRPRSSSINSNGSNHSNHTRSLSIASLESPRNSIVSIDDGFLKSTTRNNSTTSLNSVSMTPASTALNPGTPKTSSFIRERFLFNNPKLKAASNSAVVFSDDDEDPKLFRPKKINRSRSNSNSNPGPGPSNLTLNSSATTNMGNPGHSAGVGSGPSSGSSSGPGSSSGSNSRQLQPKKPEKLMLKTDYRFKFNDLLKKPFPDPRNFTPDATPSPLSLTGTDIIPNTTIEQNRENHKKKSTIKHPTNRLKKNLIFSKDVRLELMNNSKPDFGSKFPKDNDDDDETKKLPILHTLKQQNQLLSKLNRKWNKADKFMANCLGTSTDTDDDTAADTDNDNDIIPIENKRKRRYSSDTDPDTDTNG